MRSFHRLAMRPSRKAFSTDERLSYDAVVERTQRVHGGAGPAEQYFDALLNSPPLASALVHLGTLIRQGQIRGTYSDADRELMDIALAVELDSNAILPIHVPDALAVGVRPAAVEALLRRDPEGLDAYERQLVDYASQVATGSVTDESYAAICDRFGARGAVEFTVLIGFLLMTIRLWQALGVSEPSDDDILSLLEAIERGEVELPPPTARIG
jgi:alkylhydroperoxidase family enzyme